MNHIWKIDELVCSSLYNKSMNTFETIIKKTKQKSVELEDDRRLLSIFYDAIDTNHFNSDWQGSMMNYEYDTDESHWIEENLL
jgi:hypothetical protein